MLKIQNYQIDQDVISIINTLIDKKMSIIASYKLSKVVMRIHEIVKEKQELEVKIVNRYATKDADNNILQSKNEKGETIPNTFEIEPVNIEAFRTEMNDLEAFENTIDYEPIDIESMGFMESEQMSIKDIIKINFLFK